MSRARHHEKKRAKGGALKEHEVNSPPTSEEKEIRQRKHGGHVHGEGHEPKHGAHKRARGGHVGHDDAHSGMHHHLKEKSMHHVKVPGRKRGGGIGANLTPLSTAARVKQITKGEEPEEGVHSD